MTLTKKIKAEILKVNEAFWESYLKGDLKTVASLYTDDFRFIGTAQDEVFHDKKTAMKFMKETIHQIAGVFSRKNVNIKIGVIGNSVTVFDFFDGYATVNGLTSYYGSFRVTSIMKLVRGKWMIAHQHASMPDADTEAGDSMAAEKIENENRKLRDAVRRHTKELENKNRDLEIEASLERVRARAMAMQSPGELADLIGIIQGEIAGLDKNLDRSFIMLFDKSGDSTWWMSGHEKKDLKRGYHLPYHKHAPYLACLQGWKKRKQKWTYLLKGSVKKKWDNFIFKETELAQLPKVIKSNMAGTPVAHWSSSFNKFGCISTGSYEPLEASSFDLMVRFSRMFEQTYTRFLDLQKAEALAREAQIEAALEKVRSTSMAMHHSNELEKVVAVVFDKLSELGLSFDGALICFPDKTKKNIQFWIATVQLSVPIHIVVPLDKEIIKNPIVKDLQSGKEIVNKAYSGSAKDTYFRHVARHNAFPDSVKKFHLKQPAWTASFAAEKNSAVGVDSWHGQTIPLENFQVIKRFAKVFEQAYVRFLDLKKAEAQAREALIEAALEKVRSRSMGMQKSSELREVVATVFQQLENLGFNINFCNIILFDPISFDATYWLSFDETKIVPEGYHVPYSNHPLFQYQLDAWKNEALFAEFELSGKSKARWDKYISNLPDVRMLAASTVKKIQNIKKLILVSVATKSGLLQTGGTERPSNETVSILQRFAKVFDQMYTRFLDLQKAEAQAREAQIEAALERVRSRSMAMQSSSELKEVASLLFKQVKELGVVCWTTGFNIWSDDSKSYVDYVTDPTGVWMEPYVVDTTKSRVFTEISKARKQGETFYVGTMSGKEAKQAYKLLMQFGDKHQFEDILESGFQFPTSQVNHFVLGTKASLLFITYEPVPEAHDIFKRFGKVFEQVYTRFLDLQKAEAQARESQIQLALERVRARSMAMQKSEELNDVAILLFRLVSELGIKTWSAGFNVWSEDNNYYTDYIASPQGNSIDAYKIDATKFPVFVDVANARKSGVEFWVSYLEGELLKRTYLELAKSGDKMQYEKMLEDGFQFPPHQYNHFVFGQKISVMFITYDAVPEAHDIFKRFGRAFEQAYTRFLDLKKAEAQAREAQMEAALEKVRARTMGMQRSDELSEVAVLMFQLVRSFGLELWTCGFNIWDKNDKECTSWMSHPDGRMEPAYRIPLTEIPLFKRFYESRQKGIDFYVNEVAGKELKDNYKYMADQPLLGEGLRAFIKAGGQVPKRQFDHVVNFAHGNLIFITYVACPEYHELFKRLGKVFEQTYTRFLDLQKAESQAREGQIQLALERLRARTMAMHYTLELSEVAEVLFAQLKQLGAALWGCGFNICKPDDAYVERWMCRPDGKMMEPLLIPVTMGPFEQLMYDAWKNGTELITYEQGGAELQEGYESLKLHSSSEIIYKRIKELTEAGVVTAPTLLKHYVASYKYGYLWVMTTEPFEETQIFVRFAKVFEQTYTRFLDLKRAELQAREAQIEAALERVRSRTMAMHKSEELLDVITVVCEQLQHVGLEFGTVSFGKNSPTFDMDFWVAAPDLKIPIKLYAPYRDLSIYQRLKAAHGEKKSFFTDTFDAGEIKVWYQHVFDHNPEMFSQKSQEYLLSRTAMTRTVVILKNVFLFIINHDFKNYSNEENEILIRFANVFEQAYTRFLDLQKAEAQAREAQIDAALERLRARTMAMQRSSELAEVSQLLLQQFLALGVHTITCAFMFPDEEKKTQSGWTVLPDGTLLPKLLDFPLLGDAVLDERYESWKEKRPVHRRILDIEENKRHHQFLSEQVSTQISQEIFTQLPEKLTFTNANFAQGYLMTFTTEPLAHEEENILIRFAKVFEQTYTRFQDLQRAEAQAREAQIQLALERVRAKTMAMHHSSEVRDIAVAISDQLQVLGFESGSCTILLIDGETGDAEWWFGGFTGQRFQQSYYTKNFDHPAHRSMIDAFVRKEKYICLPLSGEAKRMYDDGLFINNGFESVPDQTKQWMRSLDSAIFTIAYNKHGGLHWGIGQLTDEQIDILQRFAAVFQQSYTRFLDLKKAEESARESQIEAALEKIRSRSLAMHHSGELKDVAAIMFEKLKELNVVIGTIAIQLFDQHNRDCIFWVGNNLHEEPPRVKFPYNEKVISDDGYMKDCWQAKFKGENIINRQYTKKQKVKFFDYVFASNDLTIISEAERDIIRNSIVKPDGNFVVCLINEKNSSLFADSWDGELYTEDKINVLTRAAKVFEQAYVRFLDLQKAEAQAREAQIEAALERVRAKAMAMHTAQQLKEVVHELRKQLGLLGQPDLDTCVIHLNEESQDYINAWAAIHPPGSVNEIRLFHLNVPKHGLTIIGEALDAYSNKRLDYVLRIDGRRLTQWVSYMREALPEAVAQVNESANYDVDTTSAYWSCADFQGGTLIMITQENPNEDSRTLLRRFANVFGLAYRRFADLKNAEAQAREATIETALEKIRSRSLGMHKSSDIKDVVSILFEKLKDLGLVFDGGAGIHLFREGSKDMQLCVAAPELSEILICEVPYDAEEVAHNVVLADVLRAKEKQESIVNKAYSFEEKNRYFNYIFKHNAVKETHVQLNAKSYTLTLIAEKNSLLGATSWSGQQFCDSDIELMKRVARVFEQAYIRFLDLQKAEIHAKEAVCQASLARVRAEIASMRTVADLDRITPLIWTELTAIGIQFIRCGVFIMDALNNEVHTFLSTPDGKAIAVFQLPFDLPGRLGRIVPHWQNKKMFLDYWDEAAMRETGDTLVSRGVFSSTQQYLDTLPKKGFHLHFLPFEQGMLYVGNTTRLKDEDLNLLQSLAEAFATAYARYDDFNKLEEAKRQVDNALVELKQTQQQLVQSEKMASLGELTAGIAHEIQNPLNFVNNFSEVSNELIEEMMIELRSGNVHEASSIAESIRQNLEKITHHGKRADGIVKGMLQHSRTGSGLKEATNINVLCDEYLRLAYHGYRAKDKSFNAKFETDFDSNLPKVNVIPQDIGRVTLNLINNAFYIVNEKSKAKIDGYAPCVTVSTRHVNDKIEIGVEDNGYGIPESIREKIFQPFFTTKPTGQGTGLGLSLSYDIIKAHGGTIVVNSIEGEGSKFVIQIPI